MTTLNQERKTIAALICPVCSAPIGKPCRYVSGRPTTCSARREAWRRLRDTTHVDYLLAPHVEGPVGQRTQYVLVAPQSELAIEALRALAGDRWGWIGGALRVPHQDMPDLSRRLIAAGWHTGDQI